MQNRELGVRDNPLSGQEQVHGGRFPLTNGFDVTKEEKFILLDRSAMEPPNWFRRSGGFLAVGGRELVLGIQLLVAEEFKHAAVGNCWNLTW